MVNREKMEQIMLELGHRESQAGTEYIRRGVILYERSRGCVTKEIYPAIAKACGSTPERVERCIRHSIETAWTRGSAEAQQRYFGYSIDPERGKPTNSEYLARMARLCHED